MSGFTQAAVAELEGEVEVEEEEEVEDIVRPITRENRWT